MTDHELLQALYNDMQGMKGDIQTLKADMRTVKQKVTDIELHIENVTDKNIQTIAEGHLDLSRKHDEIHNFMLQQHRAWIIIFFKISYDFLQFFPISRLFSF